MTSPRRRVGLLLDEMFPPVVAAELRERGHDVIAVAADPELRALTDVELCTLARRDGRRIVTENVKDFRRLLLADAEGSGPAVLFTSSRTFPRSRRAPGLLIAALDHWLSGSDALAAPQEVWLTPAPPVATQPES